MLLENTETKTMYNFQPFSKAVERQFAKMSKGELFVADVNPDVLWNYYLDAFPEGTNEIFRERRQHDCSCCRNFVKNIGCVVAIENGKITTVWDVEGLDFPYQNVAELLSRFIKKHKIKTIFNTKQTQYGVASTKEIKDDGKMLTWNHFVGKVDSKHQSPHPERLVGQVNTNILVFKRGLEEITQNSLDVIINLIEDNNLYRGQEFLKSVKEFRKLHEIYHSGVNKELFLWKQVKQPAALFKNTVIGTLAVDLSKEPDELEKAVRVFESKVAPTNYKRSKSLITESMVKDAMKTIETLGLEPALERRFARLEDINVQDVLFVDNSVKDKMKGGIESLLMSAVSVTKKTDIKGAQPISIQDFVSHILPNTKSIEALVEPRMTGNFMSLTAPVHKDVEPLFTWDNNFGWSYEGNITDSIKQRVKKAGGNTSAMLRCSLSWFNTDDLDIHATCPEGHVFYSNKRGILDVDMNISEPVRDAVENLAWTNPRKGNYLIWIENYRKRESIDVGFELEFEFKGVTRQFYYDKPVKENEEVDCLRFNFDGRSLNNFKVDKNLKEGVNSKNVWNIDTNTLVKVNTITTSPNHWGVNKIGNKHWFFILDGCKTDEPARGIYNEFLRNSLHKHRKVFEILGDKTKCQPTDNQLSGLGFSETKKDKLKVIASGNNFSKAYEINF